MESIPDAAIGGGGGHTWCPGASDPKRMTPPPPKPGGAVGPGAVGEDPPVGGGDIYFGTHRSHAQSCLGGPQGMVWIGGFLLSSRSQLTMDN